MAIIGEAEGVFADAPSTRLRATDGDSFRRTALSALLRSTKVLARTVNREPRQPPLLMWFDSWSATGRLPGEIKDE